MLMILLKTIEGVAMTKLVEALTEILSDHTQAISNQSLDIDPDLRPSRIPRLLLPDIRARPLIEIQGRSPLFRTCGQGSRGPATSSVSAVVGHSAISSTPTVTSVCGVVSRAPAATRSIASTTLSFVIRVIMERDFSLGLVGFEEFRDRLVAF